MKSNNFVFVLLSAAVCIAASDANSIWTPDTDVTLPNQCVDLTEYGYGMKETVSDWIRKYRNDMDQAHLEIFHAMFDPLEDVAKTAFREACAKVDAIAKNDAKPANKPADHHGGTTPNSACVIFKKLSQKSREGVINVFDNMDKEWDETHVNAFLDFVRPTKFYVDRALQDACNIKSAGRVGQATSFLPSFEQVMSTIKDATSKAVPEPVKYGADSDQQSQSKRLYSSSKTNHNERRDFWGIIRHMLGFEGTPPLFPEETDSN